MSECCTSQIQPPRSVSHRCPVNHRTYRSVSIKTIHHHIKRPWEWQNTADQYFYCDDPGCNVVYFGIDDSTITTRQLRKTTRYKQHHNNALLCYCFGISLNDYLSNPSLLKYVKQKTALSECDCVTHNPSGKCCLKDFPALS